MSSTPEFNTGQLQAARATAWHQTGEPLLTLDAVREWISTAGLVLFAARPQHVAAPAPSLVEATLGFANEAATAAEAETARSLVARLVSEGNALPLNLLGGPGATPDFVVSAQMFSFVFTLRGDKLWKQPPSTSGSPKVSPLALAAYELLADRGALTAQEIATELGREVTEAAILRSLHELWTQLRVIPLLQQGEAPTQWELTSRRFTKAIKAGINAGQPTALSALVSLYLAQALLATEDEISAFLSPLAPRSRIREVVHGLTAARQLEPVVLEGKTLLHIPGTLPEFPAAEVPVAAEGEAVAASETTEAPADEGRIKRFTRTGDRPARGGFKGKPARSFGSSSGSGERRPAARSSARPAFDGRPPSDRPDRERRPFHRDAKAGAGTKPGFTRPWDEDRKPRPAAAGGEAEAPAKPPYVRKERPAAGGFAKREGFSKRPAAGGYAKHEGGPEGGPARRSFSGGGDRKPGGFGAKRPYVRRDSGDAGESRPPRRTFGGTDSKPGSFGAKRPYVRRDSGDASGESRPARKTFGGIDSKPGFGAKRPYVRRDSGDAGGESRPPRKAFGGGDRKPGGGFGAKRPYVRRDSGDAGGESRPPRRTFGGGDSRPSFGAKRPYVRRDSGEGGGDSRPPRKAFGGGDRKPGGGFGAKRPYVRGEGESGDRPARPSFGAKRTFGDKSAGRPSRPAGARPAGDRPARPSFGGRPSSGGFSKRPGGKVPFGSKPAFGKRPASGPRAPRKPRPEAGE